jgi:hypothetical protein
MVRSGHKTIAVTSTKRRAGNNFLLTRRTAVVKPVSMSETAGPWAVRGSVLLGVV